MDTLMSIKVFRTVVELGSFVAAAERLDLSTAMASRHVMHIEQRIGVRLLNRNSRTSSLTEAGAVYFERCKVILDDLEATELELGALGTAPRGILRVTGPSWAAGQRLADLLAEYRRRYPDVVLDMSFEDRVVDLVEEGMTLHCVRFEVRAHCRRASSPGRCALQAFTSRPLASTSNATAFQHPRSISSVTISWRRAT
jgi:DNA-binding transcriptional LysR family regulator